jgi:IclR family transcriptional regulator, pca regulon regulatory protein
MSSARWQEKKRDPPDRGIRAPGDGRRPRGYVQSLARGLSVIKAFGADSPPGLTLSEVARKSGLTPATARRSLITLVDLGYVASDGRRFSLRPRLLELGHAYLASTPASQLAEPHMVALAEGVGESCSGSVLDGMEIAYVARAQTNRILNITIAIGSRLPAYPTSMGRVHLAALPPHQLDAYLDAVELKPLTSRTVTDQQRLRERLDEVRDQGWCLGDQELEDGLLSIAVPVRDPRGRVELGLNLAAPIARADRKSSPPISSPRLQETASRVEAELAAEG